MSRHKRSHGEGTYRPENGGYLCEYKRKSKMFKYADYPTKKLFLQAFAEWRGGLDAKAKAEANGILTMNDLFDRHFRRQRINEREQTYNTEKMTDKYLRPRIGSIVATDLTPDHLEEYVDGRKQDLTYKGTPPTNATINRELSIVQGSLLLHSPNPIDLKIKKLDESDGVRQGLIAREIYSSLLFELEPYQKPVWCMAFHTGVRQGELLKLERNWVDWPTRMIDVPGRSDRKRVTKNAQGHYIPLYTQAMYDLVRWAYDASDPACKYLFQREGKRISRHTFYQSMKRACVRIGQPNLFFHDTRRTAITMMIEFGFTPDEAMSISNHRDPSVFKRYNILSPAKQKQRIQQLMPRLAAMHEKNILGTNYERITSTEKTLLAADSADGGKVN
jgi:integrase